MIRLASFVAALALAAPSFAGTYSATPASTDQPGKIVARDIAWNFNGAAFAGRTGDSRPMVLCQGLAKRAGQLNSFTADGRAFSAAELAKCNGFAPGANAVIARAN